MSIEKLNTSLPLSASIKEGSSSKTSTTSADTSFSFKDALKEAQQKATPSGLGNASQNSLQTVLSSLQKKGLVSSDKVRNLLGESALSENSDLETARANLINGISFSDNSLDDVTTKATPISGPSGFSEEASPSFNLDTASTAFNSSDDAFTAG
jgi:hypothetical protein